MVKIRESVGELELIDARSSHPLLDEAKTAGIDLNDGFAIKFHNHWYQGSDALHLVGLLSSDNRLFNRLCGKLFSSKKISALVYPILKLIRNILLWLKKADPIETPQHINPSQPIFQSVFGNQWENLPDVFKQHYQNKAYTEDKVSFSGKLNIVSEGWMDVLFPVFRLLKVLTPFKGNEIPVAVQLRSHSDSAALHFYRGFHLPNKPLYHFSSMVLPLKNNLVIEKMFLGIGMRMAFICDNTKLIMEPRGYVWKFKNWVIPLPLTWLFGRVVTQQIALSSERFWLKMELTHFLLGKYSYEGDLSLIK